MNLPTIQETQEFFFRAMLEGYAANAKPISTPLGFKKIYHRKGEFLLSDEWLVTPHSNKSMGTTVIFWHDEAIWAMHYGGWYADEAIPFLKEVLTLTYQQRQFWAGRGPVVATKGDLKYKNSIDSNNFKSFKGSESISEIGKVLGTHDYRGMSLMT